MEIDVLGVVAVVDLDGVGADLLEVEDRVELVALGVVLEHLRAQLGGPHLEEFLAGVLEQLRRDTLPTVVGVDVQPEQVAVATLVDEVAFGEPAHVTLVFGDDQERVRLVEFLGEGVLTVPLGYRTVDGSRAERVRLFHRSAGDVPNRRPVVGCCFAQFHTPRSTVVIINPGVDGKPR